MKQMIPVAGPVSDQEYDRFLWVAFRNGDKEAFATLYHKYFSFLIQGSLRISGDKDLIKDCIHDLFVEMWKSKLNLGIPRSVKAYLSISLRRKIIRHVKRTRSWLPHYSCNDVPDLEVDYLADREMIARQQRQEQQKNVYKALNSLTKRQKEAVYLKYYANLSYPEIAGKMCISTDSIYNLVSKAIDAMQLELAKVALQ
jgi:RNA polymerase sigma factor (sigma-70 family)